MSETSPSGFIEFSDVTKSYGKGEAAITALNAVSFAIAKGELTVIVGPSGAGKSTLLNILGGMDTLTSGTVQVDGHHLSGASARELTEYRRTDVGFVFQFYNLIGNLTALENVEIANQISSEPLNATEVLTQVGLSHRLSNFPSQLSGGEQQRVAIARALAKQPKLLLCDEPTGALDYETGKSVLELLETTAHATGMTVVIVTHNTALTGMADKVIHVRNGQIDSCQINEHPTPVKDIEW